jgi:hypothetical protein
MFKFNNGNGTFICDECRVMLCDHAGIPKQDASLTFCSQECLAIYATRKLFPGKSARIIFGEDDAGSQEN